MLFFNVCVECVRGLLDMCAWNAWPFSHAHTPQCTYSNTHIPHNPHTPQYTRFELNWVKLRAWTLEEFDAVLLLDSDVTVVGNVTPVFTLPTAFAAVGEQDQGVISYWWVTGLVACALYYYWYRVAAWVLHWCACACVAYMCGGMLVHGDHSKLSYNSHACILVQCTATGILHNTELCIVITAWD